MQYIIYNASHTAVVNIPSSASGNTVTYAIYLSDGTSFATGTATYVASTLWKVTFTPTTNNAFYSLVVTNVTLGTVVTEQFKSTGVIGTQWDATTGAVGSSVGIANIALAKLGADRIISLDENSENARLVNAIYGTMRDDVLRSHPWNFAIKRSTPAVSATAPNWGYSYAFPIPSDCLRILRVSTTETDTLEDYKLEDDSVLCEYDTIYIKYIYRVTDSTKYDSNFIQCFALRLASELAFPITGKTDLAQLLKQEFESRISEAKAMAAQESGGAETVGEDDWELSRA